jgi:hypothetical protein
MDSRQYGSGMTRACIFPQNICDRECVTEKLHTRGTRYTVAGVITGDNVPAGEDRTLWIHLDMPTTTQTPDAQALNIEITAQPP